MDYLTESIAHLTHASDAWHNGVVEEIKLLPRFAEEKVDLIVVAHEVALGQALLDEGRAHKGGVWKKKHEDGSQSAPTIHLKTPLSSHVAFSPLFTASC